MEAELRELEQGKGDKGKADELRAELTRIRKAKDAHLEKHPDHKRFVYPVDRSAARQEQQERRPQPKAQQKQLYDKDGKLRDPTRSLYYDPVFNPYGVPPPGMPYQERRAPALYLCSHVNLELRRDVLTHSADGGRAGGVLCAARGATAE